jgi:hypothetical protein
MTKLPSQKLFDIFYSIVKGLLPPVISFIGGLLYHKFCNINRWKILKILGNDANPKGRFHLIYARLQSSKILEPILGKYIYQQPTLSGFSTHAFSAEFVVSECEMRAVNYLSSIFANCDLCRQQLNNDYISNDDISFISFGGFSNEMSKKLINDTSNNFIKLLDNGEFISAYSNNKILESYEPGYDYGFIIRLTPSQFPNRIWIACIGLGEWGTSGSTWFLANKWKEILNENKPWFNPLYLGNGADFACLIKVKQNYDNSAKLVKHFKTSQSIEQFIQSLNTPTTSLTTTNLSSDSTAVTTITISPSASEKNSNG